MVFPPAAKKKQSPNKCAFDSMRVFFKNEQKPTNWALLNRFQSKFQIPHLKQTYNREFQNQTDDDSDEYLGPRFAEEKIWKVLDGIGVFW